jgi:hypothetical protein
MLRQFPAWATPETPKNSRFYNFLSTIPTPLSFERSSAYRMRCALQGYSDRLTEPANSLLWAQEFSLTQASSSLLRGK